MLTPAVLSDADTLVEANCHRLCPSLSPARRSSYGSPPTTSLTPVKVLDEADQPSSVTSTIPCVTWRDVLTKTGWPSAARTAITRQDCAGTGKANSSRNDSTGAPDQKSNA